MKENICIYYRFVNTNTGLIYTLGTALRSRFWQFKDKAYISHCMNSGKRTHTHSQWLAAEKMCLTDRLLGSYVCAILKFVFYGLPVNALNFYLFGSFFFLLVVVTSINSSYIFISNELFVILFTHIAFI